MAPAAKANRIEEKKQRKQNVVRNMDASKNRPRETSEKTSQYGQKTIAANRASPDLFLSSRKNAATQNTPAATMGTTRRAIEFASRSGFFQKSEPNMTNAAVVVAAATP